MPLNLLPAPPSHVLLIGPPLVGASYMAREIAGAFDGTIFYADEMKRTLPNLSLI